MDLDQSENAPMVRETCFVNSLQVFVPETLGFLGGLLCLPKPVDDLLPLPAKQFPGVWRSRTRLVNFSRPNMSFVERVVQVAPLLAQGKFLELDVPKRPIAGGISFCRVKLATTGRAARPQGFGH